MMFDASPIPRPNALPPDRMSAAERRAELCDLLAFGLVRLKARERAVISRETGDICLHYSADECRHANPATPETA